MAIVAERDPAGGLLECYGNEDVDGIDVDGLENRLRPTEDNGRIARDICLPLSMRRVIWPPGGRNLQRDEGHPNMQCSRLVASTGAGPAG